MVRRDDRSSTQFGGARRMPLWDLTQGVDRPRPVILMEH